MIFQSPQNPNSQFTAKERNAPSFPTKHLLENGEITGRVLDFGCGLSADVDFLRRSNFDVIGYDPFYVPQLPTGKFDTIICNYVLNVLLPEEQSHVLMAISEFLNPSGKAYFTVRRDIARSGFRMHLIHGCQVYQCNVVLPYLSIFRNKFCEIYQYQHFNQLTHFSDNNCELCSPTSKTILISESALAYSILMQDPYRDIQVLVTPKQHYSNYFEMPQRVKTSCWMLLDRTRYVLLKRNFLDAFRVEINVGLESGQEYEHAHIALKPCFKEKS